MRGWGGAQGWGILALPSLLADHQSATGLSGPQLPRPPRRVTDCPHTTKVQACGETQRWCQDFPTQEMCAGEAGKLACRPVTPWAPEGLSCWGAVISDGFSHRQVLRGNQAESQSPLRAAVGTGGLEQRACKRPTTHTGLPHVEGKKPRPQKLVAEVTCPSPFLSRGELTREEWGT